MDATTPILEPLWATRGSQLQMQLYVNRHRAELDHAIFEQIPELRDQASALDWRVPLAPGFSEPCDAAFLQALELDRLAPALREFWPARGPVWDGLAIVRLRNGNQGALLMEAKSHAGEIYGGGSQAGSTGTTGGQASRAKIERALLETQRRLGIAEDAGRWMNPLRPDEPGHSSVYQTANRYAHLLWLRDQGVDAWLVHLLVVDDPTYGSTPREEWNRKLPGVERDLGLDGIEVPHASHVFVAGLERP